MEKLGINLGFLLVQILNFAIIFIVLRAWVYKPLLGMMDKRRKTIAESLEDARIASEARSNAETEAQKIIEKAQRTASEIVNDASNRADVAAREIRAAAEAENDKAREGMVAEIEQSRTRMLGELRSQVVALAISASEKLIGEALLKDKDKQYKLLDEFFSGVQGGKVVLLEGKEISGASVEVTSAMTLSSEEQAVIRKDLATRLGSDPVINFKVDPKILGGIIIQAGDQLLDGSVVGQLSGLRQTLTN